MSYARAEFNFFKPEVKDISYEKIQKLVEKGNVVKLDKDGIKLITDLLTSFGIKDVSSIPLGNVPQLNRVITRAIKDMKPTARTDFTVPSRPATGRTDPCEATSIEDFIQKLRILYASLGGLETGITWPRMPTTSGTDLKALIDMFKVFKSKEMATALENAFFTFDGTQHRIANAQIPENSIFPITKDNSGAIQIVSPNAASVIAQFYRYHKTPKPVEILTDSAYFQSFYNLYVIKSKRDSSGITGLFRMVKSDDEKKLVRLLTMRSTVTVLRAFSTRQEKQWFNDNTSIVWSGESPPLEQIRSTADDRDEVDARVTKALNKNLQIIKKMGFVEGDDFTLTDFENLVLAYFEDNLLVKD